MTTRSWAVMVSGSPGARCGASSSQSWVDAATSWSGPSVYLPAPACTAAPGPAARRLERQPVVDVLRHPPQLLAALHGVTAEDAKPVHLVPFFRRGQTVDQPKQLVGVVALDGGAQGVGHRGGGSPGSSPVATGYPARAPVAP